MEFAVCGPLLAVVAVVTCRAFTAVQLAEAQAKVSMLEGERLDLRKQVAALQVWVSCTACQRCCGMG